MAQIGGVINKRLDKKSKAGKAYVTVEIDGVVLNVWDTAMFGQLNAGDEVVVEYETNDQFKNITKVVASTSAKPKEEVVQDSKAIVKNNGGAVEEYHKNKEASMARMSALKNAVEFYNIQATLSHEKKLKVEKIDIYNLAEQFRNYIVGGEMFK